MANEGSSVVSTKAPLSRNTAWFFLAGGVLGALPGAFLFIVSKGGDDLLMTGPLWIILATVGGVAGGVLGLIIGGIVEWYRKESTPQV